MKKILRGTVVAAIALAALSATAIPAAAASPSGTDLTVAGQTIRPGIDLVTFGIDLTGSSLIKLSKVHADFAQVGGDSDFDTGDLEASPDGVVVWRDSSSATPATQDVLDAGDVRVSSSYTFSGMRASAAISPPLALTPASPTEGAYTFFLTVRVSPSVSDGDDFTVTLPSDAFQTSLPVFGMSSVASHSITADPVAPTVLSFAPPFTQTSPVTWQLSEPVTGVGASSVSFRLQGTTVELPASVSFSPSDNKVSVLPATPLTAGQYYEARLLPDGPGEILDRAGNELDPDARTFRAPLNVPETAFGAAYAWRTLAASPAHGGSYTVNNLAGAIATYGFTGSSITWYTVTDPYQGKAAIYVDGVLKASVNNYSSGTAYRIPRTFSGFSSGAHTITLRVTGTKGSSAGRDARVAIDGFKVGSTVVHTPAASYRWGAVASSAAQGGSYLAARLAGTSMTFTFRGTRVDWITTLGRGMGKATVTIDGITKGLFDNYSGLTIGGYSRAFGGLTDGLHTLRIIVSSSKNASATDSVIAVDGFVIH